MLLGEGGRAMLNKSLPRAHINKTPRSRVDQPAQRTAAPIPNCDDVLIYFFRNRAVPRAIKLPSCVGLDALGCARDPKSFSLLEMCYSISQSIMNHRLCGF
jgi:hypothetical protein